MEMRKTRPRPFFTWVWQSCDCFSPPKQIHFYALIFIIITHRARIMCTEILLIPIFSAVLEPNRRPKFLINSHLLKRHNGRAMSRQIILPKFSRIIYFQENWSLRFTRPFSGVSNVIWLGYLFWFRLHHWNIANKTSESSFKFDGIRIIFARLVFRINQQECLNNVPVSIHLYSNIETIIFF